jgi:transposase-like protein
MALNAQSVAEVSQESGVSEKSLYNWRNKYRQEMDDDLANDVKAGDIVFLKGPSPSSQNTKKLVDVLTALDTTIASEIT